MNTELLSSFEIDKAAQLLLRGEVVAFPTETVYGLGALLFNETAVHKIFIAKARPQDNPLIAHLSDFKDLGRIAVDIPEEFYLLAEAFMPGPLTVVLKRHPQVPSIVSADLGTIAVRFPKHPIARELLYKVNGPIVAPSANLSGKPSATRAEHVLEDLEGRIAAVLDGGPCEIGVESTVLSLEGAPQIWRPGAITAAQIEEVLKRPVISVREKDSKELAYCPSPGMKYRHYAPKAKVRLFQSEKELETYLSISDVRDCFVLSSFPLFPLPAQVLWMRLEIKELYATFRRADQLGHQEILIFCDQKTRSQEALFNRLLRASGELK